MSMRSQSVWFAGPRQAQVRTEAIEGPGPGEILVEGITSLISAGTEMVIYRGEASSVTEYALDRPGRAGQFPFPVRFGYQIVGRVREAGPGAQFVPGQVVFARHPHASLFTLPAPAGDSRWAYAVPPDLTPTRAAFANLYGVALNALLDVPVRLGERVVVSGLGLIGLFLAHLCRVSAGRLILVEPDASRRAVAAAIGADAVVAPDEAAGAVAELTGGQGADVCFEASGAPAALQALIPHTGQDGTIVVVSNYGARRVDLSLAPEFHYRRLRLVSTLGGFVNPALTPRWDLHRRAATAMTRMVQCDLDAYVSHRFPLAEAAQAYETVDRGGEGVLGVLLTYT